MLYKDRFEDSDRKSAARQSATKILDKLSELRKKNSKSNQRRWIWELLQNAKDVAFDDQPTEIVIELLRGASAQKLIFSHNGKPFTGDNITFLINQVSTKERQTSAEVKNSTGKFGTGFLTTHLLSEKVEVQGIIKDPGYDYHTFTLPLDRSGRTLEEIMESVKRSLEARNNVDNQPKLTNFNPQALNTSFSYFLNEKGLEVAQVGLEDLSLAIPYTLIFLADFKSVLIKHISEKYEVEGRKILHNNIEVFSIKKTRSNTQEIIKILKVSSEKASIAIPIVEKNGVIEVQYPHPSVPKLFCDFPLVGTEGLSLPVIINSAYFNPTEARDGVWLTDTTEDAEVEENKGIMQEVVALYHQLLDYVAVQGWRKLVRLAKISSKNVEYDWLSVDWLKQDIIAPMRHKMLSTKIVDTVNRGRIAMEEEDIFVDIPHDASNPIREQIWELCQQSDYFILPIKDDIHEWYQVIDEEEFHLTILSLVEILHKKNSIEGVRKIVSVDVIQWLNKFYALVVQKERIMNQILQDKYAIFVNQEGIFKDRSGIFVEENIDDLFKDILLKLDARNNWYALLLDRGIRPLESFKFFKKTLTDIAQDINKALKSVQNLSLVYQACHQLLALHNNADFCAIPQKLYALSQHLWEMPARRAMPHLVPEVFIEANERQIEHLLSAVSSAKTLPELAKFLRTSIAPREFVAELVDFLREQGYESLLNHKSVQVLPNQQGVFKNKEELFIDDNIDEELKDILQDLDYPIKDQLLDTHIYLDLPASRQIDMHKVADEITKLVMPKFASLPRTQADAALFRRIYVWMNHHKELAEDIFKDLFLSRHRFVGDDEIAASLEKAYILDKLLDNMGLADQPIDAETISVIAQQIQILGKIDAQDLVGIAHDRDNYILQEAEKIKARHQATDLSPDDLIASGIANADVFEEVRQERESFSQGGQQSYRQYTHEDSTYEYVRSIIDRAVKNVIRYLQETDSRYDFTGVSFSENTPTVVMAKKNGESICLVIRPSDNHKLYFFYDIEIKALERPDTELWIENGITIPERLTIGKVLRYAGIQIIYLP